MVGHRRPTPVRVPKGPESLLDPEIEFGHAIAQLLLLVCVAADNPSTLSCMMRRAGPTAWKPRSALSEGFFLALWPGSIRIRSAGGIFGFPQLVYSPRYSRGGRRGRRLPSPPMWIVTGPLYSDATCVTVTWNNWISYRQIWRRTWETFRGRWLKPLKRLGKHSSDVSLLLPNIPTTSGQHFTIAPCTSSITLFSMYNVMVVSRNPSQ